MAENTAQQGAVMEPNVLYVAFEQRIYSIQCKLWRGNNGGAENLPVVVSFAVQIVDGGGRRDTLDLPASGIDRDHLDPVLHVAPEAPVAELGAVRRGADHSVVCRRGARQERLDRHASERVSDTSS